MSSVGDTAFPTRKRDQSGAAVPVRPPLAMAWVLLLLSAAAIFIVGLLATVLIFRSLPETSVPVGPSLGTRLVLASGLTVLSLALRTLRWIFLLRRCDVRIPLRDAYVAYLSGFSLLLAPFLLGEIAVRAAVQRARGGVPVETTVLVNLWERLLDVTALALIAGGFGLAAGVADGWTWGWLAAAGATVFGPVRRGGLAAAGLVARLTARRFAPDHRPKPDRLARARTWVVALVTSVMAWLLPGVALWALVGLWEPTLSLVRAEHAFAMSSELGGLQLAPAGVVVAGGYLLDVLDAHGVAPVDAAVSVMGIRLSTVGVSTILGVLFAVMHLRSASVASASHFDAIADTYDVQIPESRRLALLARKTAMMGEVLEREHAGHRGLDVGCGQGAYLARMREMGFDVSGMDTSTGQVERARHNVGTPGLVTVGSVLQIPASNASYDFAYVINVLHHLASVEQQRLAFAELFRVLRPGGLLFVHEINTRNILFRFYMGYVFPSLNCIDEGIERWLLPHRLHLYTDQPVVERRYFTFLPDFVPQAMAGAMSSLERLLEASPLRVYSAHYMAVLRKESAS